jgi:SAM-dependent methyltransferase
MFKIEKHKNRIISLYKKKEFNYSDIEKYLNLKIQKLYPTKYEDYLFYLTNVISSYFSSGKVNSYLDVGCGTGEIVLLLNSYGYLTYGFDIYEEELKIGSELLLDNHFNKEKMIFSSLKELKSKKIEFAFMLSVFEHINDKLLLDVLSELYSLGIKKILVVVPNKYKPIDDHTGLPFLGLVNRSVALKILKLLKIEYKLSEDKIWDVYLRSPSQIESLIAKSKYVLRYLDDRDIFPALNVVKKIGLQNRFFLSFDGILNAIYDFLLVFRKYHMKNKYPYLNFILELKDE